MMAIVQDSKMRYVMMCLVCIISLALCLHFNEHATENRFQEHAYLDDDVNVADLPHDDECESHLHRHALEDSFQSHAR
jgi:hypothetical protein